MPEYKEFLTIEEIAKDYAIRRHREVNHHYNATHPYEFHLNMTVKFAEKFIHIIPEQDRADVIGGCWTHDIIEDARETYNNVKQITNESIAEYAYTLCNEKGKTRQERANEKYYEGIKSYKHATFIKLCDRLANTTYSKEQGSSMFTKYRDEFPEFKFKLHDGRYEELWNELEKLYK